MLASPIPSARLEKELRVDSSDDDDDVVVVDVVGGGGGGRKEVCCRNIVDESFATGTPTKTE